MEDGDRTHQVMLGERSEKFVLSWEVTEGKGEAVAACENLDQDPNAFWVLGWFGSGSWLWPNSNLICLARVFPHTAKKGYLIDFRGVA